jgi:hypothetical protein
MGKRAFKVRIKDVKFSFTPELLKEKAPDPFSDIQESWRSCLKTVFPNERPAKLHPDTCQKIAANASEAEVPVRLMMLCSMLAHRDSGDGRPFYPTMLFGPSAIRRTEMYRKVCCERYGIFDETSLRRFFEIGPGNGFEKNLLESEILAGSWIVGWRISKPGKAVEALFKHKETDLNPVWLAIEEEYSEIFKRHVQTPFGTKTEQDHRFSVSRITSSLKRDRTLARSVFSARERIMPAAAEAVIHQFNAQPDWFLFEKKVTNPLRFWIDIGKAVSNIFYSRALDGDMTAMRKLAGSLNRE